MFQYFIPFSAKYYSIEWLYQLLYMHSSVDGNLDCFLCVFFFGHREYYPQEHSYTFLCVCVQRYISFILEVTLLSQHNRFLQILLNEWTKN